MAELKKRRKFKGKREKPEFDQQIVDLARVTRVTKGGKQLNFRACVVIGDRRGRVGFGVQKGSDVQIAVEKAVRQAKKNMLNVSIINGTIPHMVQTKFKSGKVLIKPAPKGSGIIAGSAIRTVLELAGVPNASAKMVGRSNNKIINVKTVFKALESFLPAALQKVQTKKIKNTPADKSVKTDKKSEDNKKKQVKAIENKKTKRDNKKKTVSDTAKTINSADKK